MFVVQENERQYEESGIDGITQCVLWDNGQGGGASLVRLKAQAYFPTHNHPGWEQALVLNGKLTVGDKVINTGDYIFADKTDSHDATALEDCELFVVTEKGVEIVD